MTVDIALPDGGIWSYMTTRDHVMPSTGGIRHMAQRVKEVEPLYYTIPEVAAHARISVSTVRRHAKSGALGTSRVGKQIRISSIELRRYLGTSAGPPVAPKVVMPEVHIVASAATFDTKNGPSKPRTLQGETIDALRWLIINGQVNEALQSIPAGSVNCAVTSPPYYWQRDYEVEGQFGHEDSIQGYVTALVTAFRELRRTLAPDGTFFLNIGDTYYSAKGRPHGRDDKHSGRQMMRRKLRAVDGPGLGLPRKSLIGIPWRVALAMQDDGWTLRSSIIWHRPGTLPEPTAHDRPWRTFENVFLFSQGPRYWFDRKTIVGVEDVWKLVARPENPGSHFAPYPRELVDRCLACGCKPGGTVLDPFVGSGTTMVAAIKAGHHAIGIDLKPEYCDFSRGRIEKEFGSLQASRKRA